MPQNADPASNCAHRANEHSYENASCGVGASEHRRIRGDVRVARDEHGDLVREAKPPDALRALQRKTQRHPRERTFIATGQVGCRSWFNNNGRCNPAAEARTSGRFLSPRHSTSTPRAKAEFLPK